MSRADRAQVLAIYRSAGLTVETRSSLVFGGSSGTYYEISGVTPTIPPIPPSGQGSQDAPVFQQIARTTSSCGDMEVSLIKANDVYFIHVGGPTSANIHLPIGETTIHDFRWILHTHPLTRASTDDMIRRGPSPADREALARIQRRWPGPATAHSRVVACSGSAVRSVQIFPQGAPPAPPSAISPDERPPLIRR